MRELTPNPHCFQRNTIYFDSFDEVSVSGMEESAHGSVGWFGQREKEIGDPGGRMIQVLSDSWSVGVCDLAAQDGEDMFIDLILAEMTKGLDERSALPAGRSHVPRGGVLEVDFPPADLDLAGRAIGEEDNAGGDLLG